MSVAEDLANRLRNSVQGCSIHIHGPVQAWAAVTDAATSGKVSQSQVAATVTEACTKRILELRTLGAGPSDERIRKEVLTLAFIEKLLR